MIDRYELNKNGEGYTDLTACKAIKKATKIENKIKRSEAGEQKTLIAWANLQSKKHSELKMLFHIPNEGKRSRAYGAELKRLGMRAGVPDLFLAVPRMQNNILYGGLFIEMKTGNNKCTENQKKWIRNLMDYGYQCKVCYSADEAMQVIKNYLNI
jgi:hypothetical protein